MKINHKDTTMKNSDRIYRIFSGFTPVHRILTNPVYFPWR
jgi:hypothetical protein